MLREEDEDSQVQLVRIVTISRYIYRRTGMMRTVEKICDATAMMV